MSFAGDVVRAGGFGRLSHVRTASHRTQVPEIHLDGVCSYGVFDLEASPVTITLPDAGRRRMWMHVAASDRKTIAVVSAPGARTYTKELIGTRYVIIVVRVCADPMDPGDLVVAHSFQDAIKVKQTRIGTFQAPECGSVILPTV